MSTSRRRDRGLFVAACAVALATAVGPASTAAEAGTIQQIERYCTASWRNAGIRRQEWDDCTQQAITELLSSLSQSELTTAIEQPESEARRELNRAVWRLVQRCRRQTKEIPFVDAYAQSRPAKQEEDWQAIKRASQQCLSPRQQRILDLTREGWRSTEIAAELGTTSQRVSDEKYKAIVKLREQLAGLA